MSSRLPCALHRATPTRRHRVRLALQVAVVGVVAALATVGVVAVASAAAPGVVGHDVSYPQCGGAALPTSGGFGIVGVNGGRAFSANPCLASQYRWAKGRPSRAGVYVNTGNPAPTSSFYDLRKLRGKDLDGPSVDGGSPVRSYKIRRGTSAGSTKTLTRVRCRSATCTWTDTGARIGTTYLYRALATNTAGTGPASGEASVRAR